MFKNLNMSGYFIVNKKLCLVEYSDGLLQIETVNKDTAKCKDRKTSKLLNQIDKSNRII